MTFDRDPRWVGSVSGQDFPSPLRRFLLCLGIIPHVCPPHRPDKDDLSNTWVYHRHCHDEKTAEDLARIAKHKAAGIHYT